MHSRLLSALFVAAAALWTASPGFAQSDESALLDCSILHNGRFLYEQRPGRLIIVERNGSSQTSHRLYQRYFRTESIEWLGPCRFRVRTVTSQDPQQQPAAQRESIASVFLISDRFYEYRESAPGRDPETVRVFFLTNLQGAIASQQKIEELRGVATEAGDN